MSMISTSSSCLLISLFHSFFHHFLQLYPCYSTSRYHVKLIISSCYHYQCRRTSLGARVIWFSFTCHYLDQCNNLTHVMSASIHSISTLNFYFHLPPHCL